MVESETMARLIKQVARDAAKSNLKNWNEWLQAEHEFMEWWLTDGRMSATGERLAELRKEWARRQRD